MDYTHDEVRGFWRGWWSAVRTRPFASMLLLVLTLVFVSVCIFGGAYLAAKGTQLAKVEKKVDRINTRLTQIADAMETLVIAQRIDRIESDNSILLDYDPIPQSVRITVGPLVHYPRPNYGYRLEGRKIYMLAQKTIDRIRGRMPDGVTVEYLRRIDLRETPEDKPNKTPGPIR